jgi:hypothetical protein
MKRNLLLLAVMVVAMFFANHSWAQCPQDPIDLGICDTLYVETFDCDHTYEATGGYDSVRLAIYVTHDSNTFFWDGGQKFVQDSISGIVIPLQWSKVGCADSVKFPTTGFWNNTQTGGVLFKRSIFRDLVDCHTGDTIYNRYSEMMNTLFWAPWTVSISFTGNNAFMSMIAPGTGKWWEGSRALLATFTFLMYGLETPDCMWSKICVDSTFWPPSSNLSFTRYDAVNYVPRDGANKDFLGICDSIYIIPCLPPQITCPTGAETQHVNGTYTTTTTWSANAGGSPGILLTAVGICGQLPPGITGATVNVNPPGLPAVTATGTVTYTVGDHCLGGGPICLIATNDCAPPQTAQCSFNVTLTNAAPTFTNCADLNATIYNTATYSKTATANDIDLDPLTFYKLQGPATLTVGLNSGLIQWSPLESDTGIFHVCIEVKELPQPLTDTCCFDITVQPIPVGVNMVIIPNKVYERFGFGHWDYFDWDGLGHNYIVFDDACSPYWGINPGDFFEIPVIMKDFQVPIGGFEIEVDFDYIDLTFYGAMRGGLLSWRHYQKDYPPGDSTLWSWEYFTYRVLPCVTCACCKYKIELYGQAEMPDGQLRKGYTLTPEYLTTPLDSTWWYVDKDTAGNVIGATVAWLKFQVANNELLRDLKLPIAFEFEHKLGWNGEQWVIIQDWDCAENTFSSPDGYTLYVSGNTMQYDPTACPPLTPEQRVLTFVDGGVHVCSPCTAFTCVRGDINMNQIAYEVGDAVLFARYFVYGINVFHEDRDKQVCASDVNADGRTLMLSDLIYLIRVIQKDAVPFPKLGPSSDVANLIVSDGNITVECASSVGGLLFEFDGSVNATLLNTDMEILSNEGKVLVWSSAGNSINAGASQILSASGANLASVIAVDREGRELATTITTKLAPSTFALHSAYPNPFNPATNLSFTLPTATPYSLNIYNVAGQLVRTYEGMGNVGLNVITWNGKDNAGSEVSSGVYFYKLIAGSFTATNKMVMMK